MPEPDEGARLRALDQRLQELRRNEEGPPRGQASHRQAELGWRMVIELVSGLLVGFAIGYGLDSLFGTLPVLMVIFTLLGFAAGVRVMLRSAAEFQARAAREGGETKDEG
ncbi:MAG: AtpZ/AtpI family protein [Rubellimicrobium sp.]|nr:AtpZ/AtpI family protein [Rubellimicrobium sp.]